MRDPHHSSRRDLLKTLAVASGGAALGGLSPGALAQDAPSPDPRRPPLDPWRGLKAGVASYSLRGLKLDAAIKAIQRVDLKYVSIKDIHLKMDAPADERKAVAQQFRDAGITPISCGVVTMEND